MDTEQNKICHFLYVPFTGLGLYQGWRGRRWLRNRIKIFKQFVVPSLVAQTNQNFILWISWRYQDKYDLDVRGLEDYLEKRFPGRVVFTYAGVCFWDDKYPDAVAYNRLIDAVHGSMGELFNMMGESDTILMTIQPSDDCYSRSAVGGIQSTFAKFPELEAVCFQNGYIMNYQTKQVAEYTPDTNPPFYTIKFPRKTFTDPLKHLEFTALKEDVGKYRKGTPIPSHEYVSKALKVGSVRERLFCVGVHGENISTAWNHPFRGEMLEGAERDQVFQDFGLEHVPSLTLKVSVRKTIMRALPYGWQRKLRYWFGERLYARFYDYIRR